ncbi:hypothetical protein LCGC14_2301170 [marine sediment metagenome]|uniref:Uncharacterized protein n=1 Tax=marine sediment metagenome TaxID=412755 RepID=A0A0F9DAX5_9ZZZZ
MIRLMWRFLRMGWRIRRLYYPNETKTHSFEKIIIAGEDLIRHYGEYEPAMKEWKEQRKKDEKDMPLGFEYVDAAQFSATKRGVLWVIVLSRRVAPQRNMKCLGAWVTEKEAQDKLVELALSLSAEWVGAVVLEVEEM